MMAVEYDFDGIVGNDLIKRAVKSSVLHGRISHSYIICGGIGFGKKLLANTFAKAVLCQNSSDGEPCAKCKSCMTYETGNNPDVVHIVSQKSAMGVEQMRDDILATLATQPHYGSKRAYIIHDAHKMTPSAQNAMLLTLEEAPKHAIFLLLSDGLGGFLPTLLSRCITYKMQQIGMDEIKEKLRQKGVDDSEKTQMAAELSQGSIGRALALATDGDFFSLRDMALSLMDELKKDDIPKIFAAAKSLENHKEQIFDILDIMQMHYRQEMVLEARKDNLNAAKFNLKKIQHIDDTKQKLKSNCNFLLCMEVLMIKLAK